MIQHILHNNIPHKEIFLIYGTRKYPDALYSNLYGPTEITVDCNFYVVKREFTDDESLPIGNACKNTCRRFHPPHSTYVNTPPVNERHTCTATHRMTHALVIMSNAASGWWLEAFFEGDARFVTAEAS
jgi:hypothetical protein